VIVTLDAASFSGHDTFSFRYGWLKKGVDAAEGDPMFYGRPDALVKLGVGKNMVRSIRHWCLATRMTEERQVENSRKRAIAPSVLGRELLSDNGWDPYLEDIGSLWLLHWLLVANRARATTWHLSFAALHDAEFTRRRLFEFVQSHAKQAEKSVTENTLTRDISCFLRTYVPTDPTAKVPIEDTLDCPLVDLALIRELDGGQSYRFVIGAKPSLPDAVFGYALVQYWREQARNRNTLSVQECLYGVGSPGQVFKLDENSLVQYVDQLQVTTDGALDLDETAGLKQIYFRRPLNATVLLRDHYAQRHAA
jgi:hypothetical protein